MTDSSAATARPGKRERLVAAASELVHRQGIERTTLADIAQAADVPPGNLYYYFRAKDDIIAAVIDAHVQAIAAGMAELESRYDSPGARLKALVASVAEQREIGRYGCPYGTLSSELAKRAGGPDPLAARPMRALLDWAERQFRGMGRRDAHDLAVELVAAYQGGAVLASALGDHDLMAHQARRIDEWIDGLNPDTEHEGKPL